MGKHRSLLSSTDEFGITMKRSSVVAMANAYVVFINFERRLSIIYHSYQLKVSHHLKSLRSLTRRRLITILLRGRSWEKGKYWILQNRSVFIIIKSGNSKMTLTEILERMSKSFEIYFCCLKSLQPYEDCRRKIANKKADGVP